MRLPARVLIQAKLVTHFSYSTVPSESSNICQLDLIQIPTECYHFSQFFEVVSGKNSFTVKENNEVRLEGVQMNGTSKLHVSLQSISLTISNADKERGQLTAKCSGFKWKNKIKQNKCCDLVMSLQSRFLYIRLIKVAEDIIYTDHAY